MGQLFGSQEFLAQQQQPRREIIVLGNLWKRVNFNRYSLAW
jgi:hypothetical protein